MVRIVLTAFILLWAAATQAGAQTAAVQPSAAPPALTAPEARQMLDVLRDNAKRAQFLAVLEGLAKTLPAAAQAAPPGAASAPPVPAAAAGPQAAEPAAPTSNAPAPVSPAPAVAPAAATPGAAAPPPHPAHAAEPLPIPLAPDSLGAQILVGASNRLAVLSVELGSAARAVTDFPLFTRWIAHVAGDPDLRERMLDAAWKLAVVLAVALACERLVGRLLRHPVRALATHAPAPYSPPVPVEVEGIAAAEAGETELPRLRMSLLLLLRRLPFALGHLALEMLPVLTVAALGYLLIGTPLGSPNTARLVILAVVNAYVLCRAIVTVVRTLVAPEMPRLRLLPLTDDGAAYLLAWSRRIAVIGIFGYAFAEVALLFGLYRVAHDTLLKLVVLAIHVALIIIVLQKRRLIAGLIRGRADATGPMALIRRRLAALWHFVAVFYLIALWLVWAFDVRDGFARLVWIFASTVVVAAVARVVVVGSHGALGRWMQIDPRLRDRYPGLEQRLHRYHPIARGLATSLVAAIAGVVLFQSWGVDSMAWFEPGALGGRIISGLITISITVVAAVLTWELSNAAVQRRLSEVSKDQRGARSARLLTLLPMFRTVLMVTICLVAGLIVLSEIGVNIAPLLAGAGVVGLAIGFGSQKLVQDIITGLFLLLENAMQVGDVVTLGGLSGSVENLSIRTIRLRALDGSVHIVPFSAVTTVTNMTRDYGYAVLNVGVGLSEEPDHIASVVREVSRKMRAEPRWANAIRDDIEVLGIDRFVDLAYIMQVRIMTLPGQRWAVARELNERIKERFDELAIDSPITSTKVLGTRDAPVVHPFTPTTTGTAAG